MADILVRNVDNEIAEAMKARAARERRSLNDVARDAFRRDVERDEAARTAFWDRLADRRRRLGPMESSLDTIREFRERAW